MNHRRVWGRIALGLMSLGGCVAPLGAPSAFSSEQYLCDPANQAAFDARVETCRQDRLANRPCAGYMSFRGVFDGQDVVVDAPVFRSTYQDTTVPTTGVQEREIVSSAFSPYFRAIMDMYMVKDATTGLLTNAPRGMYADILTLEARGGNYLALLSGEVRTVQFETPDEVRVTFSGHLSGGGSVDGCFDVFPIPL